MRDEIKLYGLFFAELNILLALLLVGGRHLKGSNIVRNVVQTFIIVVPFIAFLVPWHNLYAFIMAAR